MADARAIFCICCTDDFKTTGTIGKMGTNSSELVALVVVALNDAQAVDMVASMANETAKPKSHPTVQSPARGPIPQHQPTVQCPAMVGI